MLWIRLLDKPKFNGHTEAGCVNAAGRWGKDWLKEHREELPSQIRAGKYKPQSVRRKEIPKPDGGVGKLGIPTEVNHVIQQAVAQKRIPIYEPLFSNGSYGYRPGRSAQMAIRLICPHCGVII